MIKCKAPVWSLLPVLVMAGCASSSGRPDTATEQVTPPSAVSETASIKAEQGPFQPDAEMYLCPNAVITNAFEADANNRIMNFNPLVLVDGKVVMASVPVNNACMTSGFGRRYGRTHTGLDVKAPSPATVYAAAPGIIREAEYSSGFGNNVVIDHGQGIFTRYAHMARFTPGVSVGEEIGFGQPLGIMGETGNATGIHLHFEVLTGNYNNSRRSYGLTERDPLSFPGYNFAADSS